MMAKFVLLVDDIQVRVELKYACKEYGELSAVPGAHHHLTLFVNS